MDTIFEKFSATELDNVLHAISTCDSGDGFYPEEIQTYIWLHGKIAPPIEEAMEAIRQYNDELITITPIGKTGKRYKPGNYLHRFLYLGGFKGVQEQQAADNKRNKEANQTAYQANLATMDAAASAKRSADASEVSAGAAERSASAADRSAALAKQALIIAVIAALLALAAFIKAFFLLNSLSFQL